jgi:hypothetical protein
MHNSRAIGIAAIIALCQAGVAWWIAPRSCDGGLEFYAAVGVGALVVMASLPFVLRSGQTTAGRFGWSFAFVLMSAAAWIGGLFAADVRLLCRLF